MKIKLLSMVLTAAMAVTSTTATIHATDYDETYVSEPTGTYYQIFNDVPSSHWAFSYIGDMVQRGVLNGYPDGNFYPNNTVTRAEFAKIMVGAAQIPVYQPGYKYFQDVEVDAWYAPYVHSAYPFLSGYVYRTGRYYKPNDAALREDIAVALVKLKGYDISYATTSTLSDKFDDISSISNDARPYVAVAVEKGLVSGYGDRTFRGQNTISRGEAAAMLWRAYQYGNDNKVFDDEAYTSGSEYYNDDNTSYGDYYNNNYGYSTSPTIRPTATPIPTRTPSPTATPTPKPTRTPKPTPTPEPTRTPEQERPYEMDTIVNADIDEYEDHMTYDNNDNIYYYDQSDNMIYMINMNNERVQEIADVEALTMRNDNKFDHEIDNMPELEATENPEDSDETMEKEELENVEESSDTDDSENENEPDEPIEHYLDFNVERIYYDKHHEKLLLEGRFQRITDWQRPDETFEVYDGTIYIDITDGDKPTLYTGEVTSFNDWEPHASTNDSEYAVDYARWAENGDWVEGNYLQKYNYNSREWDVVSDRELPYYNRYTLNTDGDLYYFWDVYHGKMFTCDLNGVVQYIGFQSIDDIYIRDKTNYPYRFFEGVSGYSSRIAVYVSFFHACDNGKFVFYDTQADAIRVIRER